MAGKWCCGVAQTVEKITIIAFSKDNLALVYFGPVNAPD